MGLTIHEILLSLGLRDEEATEFQERGQEIFVKQGDIVFNEGDAPRGLYILQEGELGITKQIAGRTTVLARIPPGSFVGEISLVTGQPHTATARAETDSSLYVFSADAFKDTHHAAPILRKIVVTMADRLRETEGLIQQHEKLSALGKISAGLAHELNNPSAANIRAAGQLREALITLQNLAFKLGELNLSHDQLDYLTKLQQALLARAADPPMLDPLEQSDHEEALTEWIEAQGVSDAWRLAPTFVASGMDAAELSELRDHVGVEDFDHVLNWLESTLSVSSLVNTIQQSTSRICDLVGAVKSYTYMDRSPVQSVDIHDGLENTLTILAHKLKNIKVNRYYDRSLPRLTVHGSQLNQVWTNLLDNAADALDGQGNIEIRTRREEDCAVVEIADDGPGIPPEIQTNIFEPFFTTKDVGKGTGLGLDIAYRIVVQEHGGDMRFESKPGETRFRVTLPFEVKDQKE